jgi:hypothetical protein
MKINSMHDMASTVRGRRLCRVAQMSLLRLLSNPAVMGHDVISRSTAWTVIDRLRADSRVLWADEPPDLEPVVTRVLRA